ncbi:amino acid ABC transporter ATP-binding/permease protein [Clostridium ihumii]|uniref:amino acid ABC transporter ATP-binding/permease protein n=1 Tax=Clostridium ihumii TaxID=1470356 RepID=UPI003D32EF08
MERQSGFKIMKRLIKELKPLIPFMILTIFMGVLGFLAAISITTFGAIAIGTIIDSNGIDAISLATPVLNYKMINITFTTSISIMIICAILRGPLRYIEQLSGHYIAFKILAILRDKVFTALRKLAPAKLENKEKGNLVSIITSDIELLEVFYAHTIAPIVIAIITNSIITIMLWNIHMYYGVIALMFFIIVGFVIPYTTSKFAKQSGVEYRSSFGDANSYMLDSLRGLKEILIYKNGNERLNKIHNKSINLNEKQKTIKNHEGIVRAITDFTIMMSILIFLVVGSNLIYNGEITLSILIISIVIIASSFGPVVALSNLSNNLIFTLASAERLFNILDENPEVEENLGDCNLNSLDIMYENVSFKYDNRKEILKNVNIDIKKGDKISIVGESGIGKSTFAKLLMRFFDINKGKITLGNVNLKELPTNTLRKNQVLMSQETFLFNESIEDNIKIASINATHEEVVNAAKKAAIHDFIISLSKGYETIVGELGGNLSSGEKQRIGLARAFLSKAEIMILDEPTSNLDTLNEGEILNAINHNVKEKTIVLITHRKSTETITDKIFKLENKRLHKL